MSATCSFTPPRYRPSCDRAGQQRQQRADLDRASGRSPGANGCERRADRRVALLRRRPAAGLGARRAFCGRGGRRGLLALPALAATLTQLALPPESTAARSSRGGRAPGRRRRSALARPRSARRPPPRTALTLAGEIPPIAKNGTAALARRVARRARAPPPAGRAWSASRGPDRRRCSRRRSPAAASICAGRVGREARSSRSGADELAGLAPRRCRPGRRGRRRRRRRATRSGRSLRMNSASCASQAARSDARRGEDRARRSRP